MKKLFLIISILLFAISAEAADRYWVGGGSSANWNATGNTNWGTVSGTRDNASVPGSADVAIFDAHANGATDCTLSANTTSVGSIVMTGWANTLAVGSREFRIYGNATLASGMTLTGTTGYFHQYGNGTLTTAGIPMLDIRVLAAKTLTLGDNCTFEAVKTRSVTINGTLDLNGKTLSGNSAINRLLIASGTPGTAVTLTVSADTFANADFQDISFSNADADLNLSGITGLSGDCGGNSNADVGRTVTFTTADDWYYYRSGDAAISNYSSWYTATNGGGSQMDSTRVPLPQDSIYFDANSILSVNPQITFDIRMPSVDTTGSDTFRFSSSGPIYLYGGYIIDGVTSLTAYSYYFLGRASYNISNYSGAYTYFQAVGGTYTTLSNFSIGATRDFNFFYGTFDANDFTISTGMFNFSGTGTRRIIMGSGTWNITGSSGSNVAWSVSVPTNSTITKETSTINFSSETRTQIFHGGGVEYNNITVSAGTGPLTITDSNTFNILTINAPRTVRLTSGTTQTVNSFVVVNNGTDRTVLSSVTADNIATITDADGGTNENDYLDVIDITGTPDDTWYYGANGTGDNATGWADVVAAAGRTRRVFTVR